MIDIRQSTARTLKLGPFLDEADGKTAETALTIAQADVRLSKNGGDMAQKNESTSCSHDEIGMYDCPIDATDSGTLGELVVNVHKSGALPVKQSYRVLPGWQFDSLYTANGPAPALGLIDIGTAQSVTGTTIVLRSGITVTDDVIIGATVFIYSSTNGLFERRVITDWDSATDTATVETWTQTPTGTILYAVYATAALTSAAVSQIQSGLATSAAVQALSDNVGTPADLGGGATIAENLQDIEAQTDDIGAAGAGLTAADDAILTRLGSPVGASLSADLATILSSLEVFKKNVAVANYYVFLKLAADGTPATGLSITTQISKDGGAFANLAAGATSATELGTTGVYKIAISQAEMNADDIALKFTGTGVAQAVVYIRTQA